MNSISTRLTAQPETAIKEEDEQQQFLTFVSAGEVYGVNILSVKEILEHGELTHVPMMPDYVRGVMNLRGSVVPVIDLSVRLGRQASEVAKRTCIVIIEVHYENDVLDVGVVVDAVNQVMEIASENIEPAPPFGANIRTDFIAGMGRIQEKFVVLLEVNHVLSIEELSVLEHVGKAGANLLTEQASP